MSSSTRFTSLTLAALLAAPVIGGLAAVGCRSGGNGQGNPGTAGSGGTGETGGTGAPTGGGGGAGQGQLEDGAVAFSKTELLGAFGTCAAAGAHDFRTKATALDAAAAALVATPDDASRAAARDAFRQAMASWQVMDILQFGPTGSGVMTAGGKDFRDNIYAWPTFGRCAVDEELVAKSYQSPNFGTALLANRRGLAAVEYLLFYEGQDTACTTSSSAYAGWMALSADERAARKRAYAAAAAHDVLARATSLDDAWDPAKSNFVQTMRSAGPGNAVYPTQQDAIQAVGLAIFYLDSWVKDRKLAAPLDPECGPTCVESPYGKLSKEDIRANLDGLRRVMEGCEADHAGVGFDDLLVNIGAGELATTLQQQALAAQAALDAITQADLVLAIAENRAAVDQLRAAVGTLTTTIKTSFYTVLSFEPASIPTDNDS